ncbi:hypothetical protein IFR05_002765 [Cadophora sp. M221]|nr:hypothetical protein IFR05_002765 [Cadophora sp. M221]
MSSFHKDYSKEIDEVDNLLEQMFGRPPDEENIKAWNDLMPNGRGFVTIQNETALPEMPQLNQSNPVQHALISVFHQLHCLWATKDSYFNLRDGKANETDVLHLSHCWDYLRQTIQCHADTTLEWMPNPTQHASRGWGYEHECRDFNAVYVWAEENKMKSSSGIH